MWKSIQYTKTCNINLLFNLLYNVLYNVQYNLIYIICYKFVICVMQRLVIRFQVFE